MPGTTQPTDATSLGKNAVRHFIYGAIPLAAAAIAVLWQILAPYVAHTHQGLLFGIAVYCGNISLAVWLWCAVQVVRQQFAERDRLADARVDRFQQEVYVINETLTERHAQLIARLDKLCRSVEGLHRHRVQFDECQQAILQEVAHNRNLILGTDAPSIPSQQLGPRRLN